MNEEKEGGDISSLQQPRPLPPDQRNLSTPSFEANSERRSILKGPPRKVVSDQELHNSVSFHDDDEDSESHSSEDASDENEEQLTPSIHSIATRNKIKQSSNKVFGAINARDLKKTVMLSGDNGSALTELHRIVVEHGSLDPIISQVLYI
jgi:cation transport ATPase